jgi:hypothetical protein
MWVQMYSLLTILPNLLLAYLQDFNVCQAGSGFRSSIG